VRRYPARSRIPLLNFSSGVIRNGRFTRQGDRVYPKKSAQHYNELRRSTGLPAWEANEIATSDARNV
jgi:hypothetical protein